MPEFQSSFGKIFYQRFGTTEPAILIIPGMGFSHDYYIEFANLLAKKFSVIICDHPGIGQSQSAKLPLVYSVDAITDMLVSLLQSLDINQFHVVGESYGGNIAFSAAIRYGSKVLSQTLIATSFAGCRYPRISPKVIWGNAKNLVLKGKDWDEDLYCFLFSKHTQEHEPALIQAWQKINKKKPVNLLVCKKQALAVASYHVKNELKQLRHKTLIIYGDDDRLVPARNSELLAQLIPHAQVIKLANAGHHLCFEKKQEVADAIIACLA